MKTLYLLHEDLYVGVELRLKRFAEACKKLDVQLTTVDNRNANYLQLPTLTQDDLLYKVSDFGYELETHLLNDEVITFYKSNPKVANNISSTDFTLIHNKAKIQQPKTIAHNNVIDREILKQYADYVNGFPLILKTYGLSRGVGVIRIDSWESFVSTIDFLVYSQTKFIIREYIKCNSVSRFMVLGDKVIASWFTENMEQDFRNVSDISLASHYKQKTPKLYDQSIEQIAIQAVQTLGLEFGAVDLVFDKDQVPYVLEVNFPCGLTYDPSGQNEIVEQMVTYLVDKQNLKLDKA